MIELKMGITHMEIREVSCSCRALRALPLVVMAMMVVLLLSL